MILFDFLGFLMTGFTYVLASHINFGWLISCASCTFANFVLQFNFKMPTRSTVRPYFAHIAFGAVMTFIPLTILVVILLQRGHQADQLSEKSKQLQNHQKKTLILFILADHFTVNHIENSGCEFTLDGCHKSTAGKSTIG